MVHDIFTIEVIHAHVNQHPLLITLISHVLEVLSARTHLQLLMLVNSGHIRSLRHILQGHLWVLS